MNYPAQSTTSQRLITSALRYTQHLKIIIVVAIIIEVILNCFNIITAFDFSWQLAEGEFILSHGCPAHSVLQAYGEISPHFVNEYILYEILIAALYNIFGSVGLMAFFGLISFLIYAPCLLSFYKSRNRLFLGIIILFFISQFVINLRIADRPELIAYLCFVALGATLIRHHSTSWSSRETAGVGFLFFVWANVHGSFLIGLGMLGLWFCQIMLLHWRSLIQARDYTFIRPILAGIIGSALNPSGLFRFAQPFQLHGLLWGQATSLEMWPLMPEMEWLPITCTLAAIIILLISKEKHYWLIITLLVLQYLTFNSNRYEVFIALALLVAIEYFVTNARSHSSRAASVLVLSVSRLAIHCFLAGIVFFLIQYIIFAKKLFIKDQLRCMDSRTLLVTNSSFLWLKQQTDGNYFLLSNLGANSWAQLYGVKGIHPLLDSGTHRYSDRTNQLYYYCLFRPETFRIVLSTLKINAIIVGPSNSYWASVLNRNADWKLIHIDSDSQLYLKKSQHDAAANSELFSQWESRLGGGPDFADVSVERIMRGIGIRPDQESLQMLQQTRDVSWMFDPQITYIDDWLGQVPDDLVNNALKEIDNKDGNSAKGLRILFCLRLKQYQQAAEVARDWNPSIFDRGSQNMQELRAEAFSLSGNQKEAQKTVESLWPQPRYSLRWATLCQTIYSNDKEATPFNARLLGDIAQSSEWQEETITALNANILRLSLKSP